MTKNGIPSEISAASASPLVACHYFPGWKVYENGYSPFADLKNFPLRTPLLGFYDESRPDVFDLQAKWALEHGIGCFIYCWYRRFQNVGKPVTKEGLSLCHAIEAQKHSRFGKVLSYAIMWECDNAGSIADASDLTEHLLPFWVKEYFNDENYLKIENCPVLFFYDPLLKLAKTLGGRDKVEEAFAKLREKIRLYGYDDVILLAEYRGKKPEDMDNWKSLGFTGQFAYCLPVKGIDPPQEEILTEQFSRMQAFFDYDPAFSLLTCSVGWDPSPWTENHTEVHYEENRWLLTPENFKKVLRRAKEFSSKAPKDSLMAKLILLDNWNEWCEGHYIAPHAAGGFEYLKAVREVFTACDNTPDYRLPDDADKTRFGEGIRPGAECFWYSFE